jgi:TonB family protein
MKPFVFALLALVPTLAHAQSQDAPQANAPAADAAKTSNPGTCDSWYPADAKSKGIEGVTVLQVRILTDGSVRDPSVVQSSGNGDLDKAAAACLVASEIGSIRHNGQPIEVTWQRQVAWRVGGNSVITTPKRSVARHACKGPARLPQGNFLTVLAYHIAEDGSTKDISVVQSSGSPGLDAIATECLVPSWQYPPALQNGQPVEIDGMARIPWHFE